MASCRLRVSAWQHQAHVPHLHLIHGNASAMTCTSLQCIQCMRHVLLACTDKLACASACCDSHQWRASLQVAVDADHETCIDPFSFMSAIVWLCTATTELLCGQRAGELDRS